MQSADLKLEDLLLDPVNYRLQDEVNYRPVARDRFHLEQVQRAVFLQLKNSGIKELRDSIIANGFLPIERIVVAPYDNAEAPGKYVVIEGNRRVAALRQIKEENDGGVVIPDEVVAVLDAVPCIIFDEQGVSYFRETLMGIRHVGGIKQWGGYQRAKLISDLRDVHGVEAQEVAAKLGLSTLEVNRRYRAYKALQQMRDDEEYGDLAQPSLYPIFHEAISSTEVRGWLGWNKDTNEFDDAETIKQFYALITPYTPEEGSAERPPKLGTYSDVRQLKHILPNVDAKRYLLDMDRPFLDALTVSGREELSRKWRNELIEAVASLEGITALEVKNFSVEDVDLLTRLQSSAAQIQDLFQAVSRAS